MNPLCFGFLSRFPSPFHLPSFQRLTDFSILALVWSKDGSNLYAIGSTIVTFNTNTYQIKSQVNLSEIIDFPNLDQSSNTLYGIHINMPYRLVNLAVIDVVTGMNPQSSPSTLLWLNVHGNEPNQALHGEKSSLTPPAVSSPFFCFHCFPACGELPHHPTVDFDFLHGDHHDFLCFFFFFPFLQPPRDITTANLIS